MENTETKVETAPIVAAGTETTNPEVKATSETKAEKTPEATPAPTKESKEDELPDTLTKAEFSTKLLERMARQKEGIFKKLGITQDSDLDNLVSKAKLADTLSAENATMKADMTILKNNIDPAKAEDVKIYFKGLGIPIDEKSLQEQLAKHPEWGSVKPTSNVVSIPIGTEQTKNENIDPQTKKIRKVMGLPI